MIFKYEIEIDVDDGTLELKYPNYQLNYANPKEFADVIVSSFETKDLEGGENGLRKWGYSIKVTRCSEV